MRKFVILGGGTAGWLTALFMKYNFKNDSVTLIQNAEIGIIGVGEATTPNIISFLKQMEIDPLDVLRETGGGIKNGVNFVNWNGDGKRYLHSFRDTMANFTMEPTFSTECLDYYLKNLMARNLPFEEYIYQIKLSYSNKIDLEHTEWALHFDTNLFSQYLQKIGAERNIDIVDGKFKNAIQDENGNITKLYLEDGREYDCDFVFDCTGFSRLLIDGVFKEKWISYKKHLPMKKGIPFWLNAEDPLEPHTGAIAMKYGWIWKIPLLHRTGSGYIFDSDYIDENQALEEAEELFGTKLEVRRIIPFEAGRFDRYWINNCMAVGLSSSFIEPLESTSIFLSIGQLQTFKHFFNEIGNTYESSREVFNRIVGNNMDDTLNFIYFHYLTKRDDSDFWKSFRSNYPPPTKIAELMELIKENNLRSYNLPKKELTTYFDQYSYLQVGRGLGVFEKEMRVSGHENIQPSIEEYKKIIDHLYPFAHDHRTFLENLKK